MKAIITVLILIVIGHLIWTFTIDYKSKESSSTEDTVLKPKPVPVESHEPMTMDWALNGARDFLESGNGEAECVIKYEKNWMYICHR